MTQPSKIELANLPTPIQSIKFNQSNFFIKRDDFTGTELSGNKIRKLEYLLADAKRKRADIIYTCGGDQSNHCRATVLAAAKLGIKSKLFLWGREAKNPKGNLFLNNILDVEIQYLPFSKYKHVSSLMMSDAEERKSKNEKVYIIPTGGSNALGIWGYINFINEIKLQKKFSSIDGILCANGSGGTIAGMLLGLSLNGIRKKLFGVNVIGSKNEMFSIIQSIIEECISKYKLKVKVDYNLIELMDGYSTEGYKKTSSQKIDLIKEFSQESGIILDPTYTGKAFYAYNENFLNGKKRSNILFLHTGGLFGTFAKSYLF